MRMLTAQAIADEGEIEVLGHELPRESKAARAECGVVPQLDNLDTTLTVEQNLLVFTYLYRVARRGAARPRSSARWRSRNLGRPARREGRRAQRRHAPAAAHRPRARPPAAARAARRADRRPGPAGAPGAVGAHRRAALARAPRSSCRRTTSRRPQRLADTVTIMSHGRAVAIGPPSELVAEHAGREALEVYGAARAPGRGRGARRGPQGLRTRRTGTSVSIMRRERRRCPRASGDRRTSRTSSCCSRARRLH